MNLVHYNIVLIKCEIKTPLTHIHHLLDLLKFAKTDNAREQYIEEIYEVTTQLSELTKALLLLSEIDNGAHLDFDDDIQLNQLIKKIIRHEQFSANEKDLILMSDLETISMNGNERLLHQAFQNLITNAIQYSTTGGMVDVTLSQNLETQARIFERFYKSSNHDNSNGLGLAIAKAIFELHHGTITVDSEKNAGTTFTITFKKVPKTIS